jgi:hypothetical protein
MSDVNLDAKSVAIRRSHREEILKKYVRREIEGNARFKSLIGTDKSGRLGLEKLKVS